MTLSTGFRTNKTMIEKAMELFACVDENKMELFACVDEAWFFFQLRTKFRAATSRFCTESKASQALFVFGTF